MSLQYTVCICAKAEDIELARKLALDWCNEAGYHHTLNEMLPIPLSIKGENPPTHYLCCMQLTQKQIQHMQKHKAAHNSPVTLTLVGEQPDGHQYKKPNMDKWLQTNQLKVIDG